jgi:peptide/nickel transport system substrate-binding protein
MLDQQEHFPERAIAHRAIATVGVFLLAAFSACRANTPAAVSQSDFSELRVGVGQVEAASSIAGVRQFLGNLSLDALVKIGEDGRARPSLAKSWSVDQDGLSITIELQKDVKFHDGSPLSAEIVVKILQARLPREMGPAFDDVLSIEAQGGDRIEFKLKRPAPFVLEALEGSIQKPGSSGIGTGAFVPSDTGTPAEMRANDSYYLGRPQIDRVVVNTYPSVRTAWAEMLRGNLDMVYDAGVEARDSLESATSIGVYAYTRHYQYVVLFNTNAPSLRSASVRRALNAAIDRNAFVQDALNNHGTPSSGPVWPRHWAADDKMPVFRFDPQMAATALQSEGRGSSDRLGGVRFTCLVTPNDERVALVVKSQLQAVGADMAVEETSIAQIEEVLAKRQFEAILVDVISGPNIFRTYSWWHSRGTRNRGTFSSAAVDAGLDDIRHAASDAEYHDGVARFQQAVIDDPPAIFLAWSERARAVSRRFEVPSEPGVDILGTLRMWRPIGEVGQQIN